MPRKDKSASEWTLKKFKNIKLKYNDTFVSLNDFSETILDHLEEADSEKVKKTLHQKKKRLSFIHGKILELYNRYKERKNRRNRESTGKVEQSR